MTLSVERLIVFARFRWIPQLNPIVGEGERRVDIEVSSVPGDEWMGAGYASEAVGAVLNGFREKITATQILAIITEPNVRSMRTAMRIGF